jgi:mycobactin lysine-N-oxygenase
MRSTNRELLVIGGGPKAIAIALLAFVLQRLGNYPNLRVTILERKQLAANWSGDNGCTDGEFPLDTSPFKDLGFPYQTGYGRSIDRLLGDYSFVEFLKEEGRYADFISRGNFKISHRQFAEYNWWVANRISPQIVIGTANRIRAGSSGLEVSYQGEFGGTGVLNADGVVVTGPGLEIKMPGQDNCGDRAVGGRDYWLVRHRFRDDSVNRVAVVGGGQMAGTVAKSILQSNPRARVDIINSRGFLSAQSAGFHENSLCSLPNDDWARLPLIERKDILNRINNGVVDSDVKGFLDGQPRLNIVRGRVQALERNGDDVVCVKLGERELKYDMVVVAIGFDMHSQLVSLLASDLIDEAELSLLASAPELDHNLRIRTRSGMIHVPTLAALSQGPGLSLLSCLGTVASRIVSAYVPQTQVKPEPKLETLGFWC